MNALALAHKAKQSIGQGRDDMIGPIVSRGLPTLVTIADVPPATKSRDTIDHDLSNVNSGGGDYSLTDTSNAPEQWDKIQDWFNELTFYSMVFQFFGEDLKEQQASLGWWIIIISSFTSFLTLFNLEPFHLSGSDKEAYEWFKGVILACLSITTTLIAAWMKKKGYVRRIKEIDKRIGCLETFLSRLEYQIRLVPVEYRQDYLKFITERRNEYTDLSVYTNLISPSELMQTVYTITRYNSPMVKGVWPWYDPATKKARPSFSQHIIDTYHDKNSWRAMCCHMCAPRNNDRSNPLLAVSTGSPDMGLDR